MSYDLKKRLLETTASGPARAVSILLGENEPDTDGLTHLLKDELRSVRPLKEDGVFVYQVPPAEPKWTPLDVWCVKHGVALRAKISRAELEAKHG